VRLLAGFAIAVTLLLPGMAWFSSSAAASDPPQFWQSRETIVRVVNLPDSALYKRGYNIYVDLGYHFYADGSGEWVGYATNGRRETLDTIRLGMMLNAAGLDRLPQVPDRPASTATYMFFFANGLIQLGLILRIVINNMKDSKTDNRQALRSLLGRRPASQKDKSKSSSPSTPGPVDSYSIPGEMGANVIVQRGIHATATIAAQFGRRG